METEDTQMQLDSQQQNQELESEQQQGLQDQEQEQHGYIDNLLSRQPKRDKRVQNCVSNFSLYAKLVVDRPNDPLDDPENEEPFKLKLSKSAKKRIRRQRKLKLSALEKQVKSAIIKKKTKHEMKSIMKKIKKL